MNKLIPITGLIALILLINFMTASDNLNNTNITCSKDLIITYFYQPGCSHCVKVEPLIDSMINNGCNITKINAREFPLIAISNNITATPTLIINNNRLIGEFTAQEVKDLIT